MGSCIYTKSRGGSTGCLGLEGKYFWICYSLGNVYQFKHYEYLGEDIFFFCCIVLSLASVPGPQALSSSSIPVIVTIKHIPWYMESRSTIDTWYGLQLWTSRNSILTRILFFFLRGVYFFIVVRLELSPFFPYYSSYPAHPLPHSVFPVAPVVGVHGSLIHGPWLDPSPSFPHYPSPTSPLVTVSLFFISMSLVVLFCSLVCFVD